MDATRLLDALGLVGYRRVAHRPWSMRARAPAFLPTPGPLRSRAPRQHGFSDPPVPIGRDPHECLTGSWIVLGLVGYRRVAYRPWSMRARAPAFLPTPGPLRSWAPRQHGPTEQAAGLCCMKSGRSLSRPRGETRGPRHRVTQLLTTPQCLLLVPNRESFAVR